MSAVWQDIIALTLVALSAGWLLRRAWRTFAAKSGCTGCGSCPAAQPDSKQHVHTISLLSK